MWQRRGRVRSMEVSAEEEAPISSVRKEIPVDTVTGTKMVGHKQDMLTGGAVGPPNPGSSQRLC